MNKLFSKAGLVALLLAVGLNVLAQEATPVIAFHTDLYENYGASNAFTVVIGAQSPGYISIDCGYGLEEYEVDVAVLDSTSELTGTSITCTVNAAGDVKIYADEGVVIDFFNGFGCGITDIEFNAPETIEILNLEHNSLHALDLSDLTNAKALYLNDNPCDVKPLIVGGNKPGLIILEMNIIDYVDPSFTLRDFPSLRVFDSMSSYSLTECDPTGCPNLQKLSIDATHVKTLDVTQNPELLILNISDTEIRSIDLSQNKKLQQFYCDHQGSINEHVKLTELDLTACPNLIFLFCSGNNLTSIDLSKNTILSELYIRNNKLTSLDLSNNENLYNVMISKNYLDFSTLPINPGSWVGYEYEQRPLVVPQSYLVGSALDLSSKVLREGGITDVTLYSVSESNPAVSTEVEPSKYTYSDGVLTINSVIPDSVYAVFSNTLFPEFDLRTANFKVKDADSYGKDDLVIDINSYLYSGAAVQMYVGIEGATEEHPKTFSIDWGDGNPQTYTATGWRLPTVPNVDITKSTNNGRIKIYVPENEKLTAFGLRDAYLGSIDLTEAKALRYLVLENTELYSNYIDLKWNRALDSLVLTGNHFTSGISLDGANGYYNKNMLYYIDLSNNEIPAKGLTLSPIGAIKHLDLSHNKLSEVNFTDGDYIEYLDVSYNEFEYLKINYLASLKTLNVSHNKLSEIVMPETNVIEWMDCSHNNFTLASMPTRNGLDEAHFLYAPQAAIPIPTKGSGFDLSAQYLTIDGATTAFTWKAVDGSEVVEGVDYTVDKGASAFLDPSIGKTLYCEITHAAYPAFSGENVLKTSAMESAGIPNNMIASFTTPVGGQEISLSLTSSEVSDAIYIDWGGNGIVTQYLLTTTYTVYSATTKANANVKIYTYDDVANLTVFSVSGATLRDVNIEKLTNLTTLTLSDAGLSSINLPDAPIRELNLSSNNFTTFDFAGKTGLELVSFANNKFESVDLSGLPNLQTVSFANNQLTSVTFGNNKLWHADFANNKLDAIDLQGAPRMYQIWLNGNNLSQIDADDLKDLRVLYIDHNKFTFETLPQPREQWTVYIYGNQAPIAVTAEDGIVDLSSQAMVGDSATTYIWYLDEPVLDEYGYLDGEMLYEDEEYTVDGGVTTFLKSFDNVMCVMLNSVFPNTFMYTPLIDVKVSTGLAGVVADSNINVFVQGHQVAVHAAADAVVNVYSVVGELVHTAKTNHDGVASVTSLPSGTYVISVQGVTAKIVVK